MLNVQNFLQTCSADTLVLKKCNCEGCMQQVNSPDSISARWGKLPYWHRSIMGNGWNFKISRRRENWTVFVLQQLNKDIQNSLVYENSLWCRRVKHLHIWQHDLNLLAKQLKMHWYVIQESPVKLHEQQKWIFSSVQPIKMEGEAAKQKVRAYLSNALMCWYETWGPDVQSILRPF